jgi:hypothetical protein
LNTRTFNTICILAIIAVGAMAMFMVQNAHDDQATTNLQASSNVQDAASSTTAIVLQPLSLGLGLAVVADLGLMTIGLVLLFKDDMPGRDRFQ